MKRILLIAAVVVAAAACGNRTSDITKVYGEVPAGLDEVYVFLDELGIDTLVTAQDGKFYIELPKCLTCAAAVEAGYNAVQFISDGTELDIVMEDGASVKSRQPKVSVQERMNEFNEKSVQFETEFQKEAQEIMDDSDSDQYEKEEKLAALSNKKLDELKEFNSAAINANRDNLIGAIAFVNMAQFFDDDQIGQALGTLAPEVKKIEIVGIIESLYNARQETAVGKQFKDFTVENVLGYNEYGEPVTERASLSDYVGNGYYTLVHFWSAENDHSKALIPYLQDAYRVYGDLGLRVLSVSVWDDPKEASDTAARYGIGWDKINNVSEEASRAYGFMDVPLLVLFSPEGAILRRDAYGEEILTTLDTYFVD